MRLPGAFWRWLKIKRKGIFRLGRERFKGGAIEWRQVATRPSKTWLLVTFNEG